MKYAGTLGFFAFGALAFLMGTTVRPSESLLAPNSAGAATQPGPATAASKVPLATERDLDLSIVFDRDPRVIGRRKNVETVVIAYMRNISTSPVRVYVPGFVGPIRHEGPSSNAQPEFGSGDYVVLRPDEAIARTFDTGGVPRRAQYYCLYSIYSSDADSQKPIEGPMLDSNGVYTPAKPAAVAPRRRAR